MKKILGIDLGGALQKTTGYAVLHGHEEPNLDRAGVICKAAHPAEAEQRLLSLILEAEPDVVAIDAPLTLPPCLSCSVECRGPSPDDCEVEWSKEVWAAGGNPLSERLCEVLLRRELGGQRPQPTMRVGQIAARGSALARRLRAMGVRTTVIEVYPTASLSRLRMPNRPSAKSSVERQSHFRLSVLSSLSQSIGRIYEQESVAHNDHAFDGLLAAYTGWLYPEGLEKPPPGFDTSAGWIWAPKAAESPRGNSDRS